MKKNKRPWGYYENLLEDHIGKKLYKIKRIVVKPKSKLSLQKHRYRSELWVILEGRGKVVNNRGEFKIVTGNIIAIKRNEKHRLINNSKKRLVILESQTGSYLGEDDIIRYEDDFGRIK